MLNDRLEKELQRQEEYLNRLPEDFEFPLFNSKQALESQRRNGYRNTAAAAREIVDNAIEAAARNIHIVFDYNKSEKGRTLVSSIAFIDDGSGMHPKMARYALSLGGGTHFDDPDFIGKFGFGLPNASINQTLLVEVYTRTSKKRDVVKASLDVRRVKQYGLHSVEPAEKAPLPAFVKKYMDRNNIDFDHGTVVVWVNPDRLTYHKGATLKEHLVDDFGVTYRYLLDDVSIFVEGVKVEVVDPLFLDNRSRYYLPESEGGAVQVMNRVIPVGYYHDPEIDAYSLKKLDSLDENDKNLIATGGIQIRIGRFPVGFAVHARRDKLETDANRRFEIRKTRRGMSFVRAKREIETVDAFPRSVRDRSNGLGSWPLLQGYAYHWGVEIKFEPSLDEVFGITNDKQTVRPIEDFWRLLHDEGIDRALRDENLWQTEQREKAKPQPAVTDEPSPAEKAAALADSIAGKRSKVPERLKPKVNEEFDREAKRRVGVTAKSLDEARAAMEDEAKRRPYKIDYFEDANGPFYEPRWENATQIVARINRLHPFYKTLYSELYGLLGGKRAKEAVDVFVLALTKGELTVDDPMAEMWYKAQRERVWSPFLGDAMQVLAQTLHATEEKESLDDRESAAA